MWCISRRRETDSKIRETKGKRKTTRNEIHRISQVENQIEDVSGRKRGNALLGNTEQTGEGVERKEKRERIFEDMQRAKNSIRPERPAGCVEGGRRRRGSPADVRSSYAN